MQDNLMFLSAIDNLRDPVRNTRWRCLIPDEVWQATGLAPTNGGAFVGEDGTNDFALHVKTATIPSISVTEGAISYMGFKSHFPTNATIHGSAKFDAIMLEDMRAYEAMLAWQQNMINTGLLVDKEGSDKMNKTGLRLGGGSHKDKQNPTHQVLRNSTVKVELYNWMTHDVILRINYINAYPKTVSGASLSYENASLVNFSFDLQYDRWTLYVPEQYRTGKNAGEPR